MSDEEDRDTQVFPQVSQELEDPGLDRDVEGGGGFVGKEKVGVGHEGHGNHGPLAHATGKFMREGTGPLLGVPDSHLLHHGEGSFLGLFPGSVLMGQNGLGHLVENPQVGVETAHGVLKDHGDPFSSDGSEQGRGKVEQLLPVEDDGTAFDFGRWLGQ